MSTPENFPQAPQPQPDGQGFPQAPQGNLNQAQNYGAPAQQQFNQPYPGNTGAGYGQPVDLAEPKNHKTSVLLLWGALALSLIGLIIGFLTIDFLADQAVKQAQEQNPGVTIDRSQIKPFLIGSLLGIGLITLLINILVIVFWKKGHNWARIILTIFAVLALFGLFSAFRQIGINPTGSILNILSSLLTIAATVLAWTKPVSDWINAKKAAKLRAQGL